MEVTFETAALADAVSKAARVAPTKGAAYDKSAGIKIEVRPDGEHAVTIKATDLEVTYIEWVAASLPIGATEVDWRLPAQLLAGIVGNLPLGKSQQVTLSDDEKGYIKIASGKAKAKIRHLTGDVFPIWEPFDDMNLKEVSGFTQRVAQVSWACDKNMIPVTGVHINGTHLIATDRYRLAQVPCVVPVDEPITVPLDVIVPMLKNVNDARMGAVDGKFLLMPDGHSQITSVIFDASYPNISRAMHDDYTEHFVINTEQFRNALLRMMVLVKAERYPLCKLTIGGCRVHVLMDVPEVGEMEDEIEVVGADHQDDYEIQFTPTYLTDALGGTEKETVTFSYDRTSNKIVRIKDSDEYSVWIVPRMSA